MDENSFFKGLIEYIESVTGLGTRDAARIAFGFNPEDGMPTPPEIVAEARTCGFDIEEKHATKTAHAPLGEAVTMDPAEVLTEMYLACPRAVMSKTPRIGASPDHAAIPEEVRALLANVPDEIALAVADINLFEGSATFWLHDAANDIDRPIGPIDLTRYTSGAEIAEALTDLLRRINKVLAADTN